MKNRGFWLAIICILLTLLSGCTPPEVLYLTPGRYLDPVGENDSRAQVVLQDFSEQFAPGEYVGEHFIGSSKSQAIKIKPGKVADTLDTFLSERFTEKGVAFRQAGLWDLSLNGLSEFSGSGAPLVVGGRILRLSVIADSGVTRLTTKIKLGMDVECYVGRVGEQIIIKKTIYINEKMVKFSANQRAMEEVLDSFLAEAARQVMINLEDSLAPFIDLGE